MNNPDYDSEKFYKVYEAYETLSSEEKRRAYNETLLMIIQANEIIKRPKDPKEWNESLKRLSLKRLRNWKRSLIQESFPSMDFMSTVISFCLFTLVIKAQNNGKRI